MKRVKRFIVRYCAGAMIIVGAMIGCVVLCSAIGLFFWGVNEHPLITLAALVLLPPLIIAVIESKEDAR